MRVVVAHNFYRSDVPSGENRVVEDEAQLLSEICGVEVVRLYRSSDDLRRPIARAQAALGSITAPCAERELSSILKTRRPTVVHLHNAYPMISPGVIRSARKHGAAVVHTVHNYRHTCLAGTHFRNHAVCTDCIGRKVPWPAVEHACYRGSRTQSLVMAAGTTASRVAWEGVTTWIALTPFMAQHLTQHRGVPPGKIRIRPTWAHAPAPHPAASEATSGYRASQTNDPFLLFLGRLDEPKGVLLLLDAWELAAPRGLRLVIAGSGPLEDHVRSRCARLPEVRYAGPLSGDSLIAALRDAAAVVVPSVWYEGLPRTVVEAFSYGRPVIASQLGSLGSVVDDRVGWLAAPTVQSLASTLRRVSPEACAQKGLAALERFWSTHSAEAAADSLIAIYEHALRSTTQESGRAC